MITIEKNSVFKNNIAQNPYFQKKRSIVEQSFIQIDSSLRSE